MLAARDQENLVYGHHQAAASKPLNQSSRGLQPKTPGNTYPKTPLKIPLNDENAPVGFAGKSGKSKGPDGGLMTVKKSATFDKNAFVTPMGPRTRAPLGMKTTNAKAKAFHTPAGAAPEKEVEKTQPKQQTSARRPKKLIHAEAVKLQVHGDESPLADRDVEYCPPKPKDLPYQSTDFPDNCLDYSVLQPGNLMKGINRSYRQTVDENGKSRIEREAEERYQKSAKACDEAVLKMMEEDWTVGDVPETFRHVRNKKSPLAQDQATAARQPLGEVKKAQVQSQGPGTIKSRKAASALSVPSKAAPLAPKSSKPIPTVSFLSRPKRTPAPAVSSNASTMRHAIAEAASRSTIGYTKGRSASGILHTQHPPTPAPKLERVMQRSPSNVSMASDHTITPARFAKEREPESDWKKPSFLKAFEQVDDDDDDDLEPGLRGALPECLRREDEEDEEFVMTLGGGS
ncbi:uncharacterized protein L3040_007806 [Drepanopeziza brunnea f. sp. 'multigermtubi']|uniref:Uncharacterized protein n=1 Tax=Marssonina brunnea f. sp. multigermtubi (strain MB_m1) TaxID=1072389 RepID=K1XU19_MARBU|nr:uncharacterized protein MBM_05398 [Drepanopeziza brunnea f. sp. 'multigermtubi' MB_m1]EKD16104.1 hypothetical protein MBM_05398 [Drepanopeziza brunnea f. sp. 'multigermtubi' MB_m1]KAJ5035331.1 hypothetical protein L3040_007806 [Drepanopeziza brunnea f. sp. 'multigermtubi']